VCNYRIHHTTVDITVYLEILIIALLIGANAIFAMAEFAVISARRFRLRYRAQHGDRGSGAALELAERPNRFLSTVQVGITLVGIIVGAISGVTFAQPLSDLLSTFPFLFTYHQVVAAALIVLVVTYFTLVFGELVPKRIALLNPERVAARLAHSMQIVSAVAYPAVRILSLSTEGILRIAGQSGSDQTPVTEEEIQLLIEQGTKAGVIEEAEEAMIKRVIRLGDLRVSALMTPRPDIIAIELQDPPERIGEIIRKSGHTRFPVFRGSVDTILGVVTARDILEAQIAEKEIDLERLLTPPLFVPESLPVLKMLEEYHQRGTKISLVVDEYAGVVGLITPHDILEEIAGEIPEEYESPGQQAIQRPDGSWLIDGMIRLDEFRELFPVGSLTGEERGHYQTLSGFIMTYLGRIPEVGDRFEWGELRFEVVQMQGARVHRVLVTPLFPEIGTG
jgi:putative hemolysin